uniref:adenosylmethionine decarboxylase n=1 Tax=Panagrellus redivivus TaxID=6233 RepID=A0A7E4ZXU5_PANRE
MTHWEKQIYVSKKQDGVYGCEAPHPRASPSTSLAGPCSCHFYTTQPSPTTTIQPFNMTTTSNLEVSLIETTPIEEVISSCPSEVESDTISDDGGHFFEGAEKLLEVWFDADDDPNAKSLRLIPYDEIEALLEIAQCHILHFKTNGILDSYVLSESSMFISDNRVIMKTCGTTKLLDSVERLLQLADKYAGLTKVANVYYSRKNFLKPDLQPAIHQNFDSEVDHLDAFFEEGAAYCMGSLKEHRWYLYTMSMPQAPPAHPDHTLEICMTNIPDDTLAVYSKAVSADGPECTRLGGIDKLVPEGTLIHEELFDPVGYSMNGLLPDSDQYVTIHITPEPDFCYVSFETNQREECLYRQTLKVLDCFKPREFLMTVFANDISKSGTETQLMLWNQDIPGYTRTSLQFLRLQYDTLVYAQFTQRQFVGKKKPVFKKRRLVHGPGSDSDE